MNQAEVRVAHSLLRFLAERLPADLPVRAIVPNKLVDQGDCLDQTTHYRIRLRRSLPLRQALGVVIHEYAHALSYDLDADEPHGEMFHEAKRLCFETFVDWRKEQRG